MVDPQPTLVERLVRHALLLHALLPQIEVNSIDIGKPVRRCSLHSLDYPEIFRPLSQRG
jgi:hypothetical protein